MPGSATQPVQQYRLCWRVRRVEDVLIATVVDVDGCYAWSAEGVLLGEELGVELWEYFLEKAGNGQVWPFPWEISVLAGFGRYGHPEEPGA